MDPLAMSDRHTPEQRSRNMARIRKFGNASTELRLRRLLRAAGITGWRRHLPLPGRPDFTFRQQRVVLFIDGCFWHRCPRCAAMPATNAEYWQRKFARNIERDRDANRRLRRAGWRVLRIWEHALTRPARTLGRIRRALARGGAAAPRPPVQRRARPQQPAPQP